MQELIPIAERIATILKQRKQTVVIAESSTGGLISSALLAIPGASEYFLGGLVIYTLKARRTLVDLPDSAFSGMRASTEPYVQLISRRVREQFGANWCVAESGATGPSGNRYGDAPGHSAIAVAGEVERSLIIETGSADRPGNMRKFASAGLNLLRECLG